MISQALQDGIEPQLPESRGGLFQCGSVFAGRMRRFGGTDACMVQFTGVAHIPALQAGSGDLGMELQSQREIFDGECLIG